MPDLRFSKFYDDTIHYLFIMRKDIFQSTLNKVGDSHQYQTLVTAIACVIAAQVSITGLLQPYLLYQSDYECDSSISNCQEYVCSLPPS